MTRTLAAGVSRRPLVRAHSRRSHRLATGVCADSARPGYSGTRVRGGPRAFGTRLLFLVPRKHTVPRSRNAEASAGAPERRGGRMNPEAIAAFTVPAFLFGIPLAWVVFNGWQKVVRLRI